MKEQRIVMGMPVAIEIAGHDTTADDFERLFSYFQYVDDTFSPYKATSETTRMNKGLLPLSECSEDMRTIVRLAEQTRLETNGYFNVFKNGQFNPVGIVKGWAIHNISEMLRKEGVWDFFVEAGGDIQLSGLNDQREYWVVGIRNPFDPQEVVKVLRLSDMGIATSGTYVRGQHIYNPLATEDRPIEEIVSVTVLGPNVYEADRFATAAFAMGPEGIHFIEELPGFEGYLIDKSGLATMTSGFEDYVAPSTTGPGSRVTS
jgi:thiamine biosynthesis lipoprotein